MKIIWKNYFFSFMFLLLTIKINSLKSSLRNELNLETLASKEPTLPDKKTGEHNFLETEETMSKTDFYSNLNKIYKKDESLGKDLYDYFQGDLHKNEKSLQYDNKYQMDSIKTKIENNGYQMYENLINLVDKMPDTIAKVDTRKLMHFEDHSARFKEVMSSLAKTEKSFKLSENEYNSVNKSKNGLFEDGPIDLGSMNQFFG